jgi:hypothetical protein
MDLNEIIADAAELSGPVSEAVEEERTRRNGELGSSDVDTAILVRILQKLDEIAAK